MTEDVIRERFLLAVSHALSCNVTTVSARGGRSKLVLERQAVYVRAERLEENGRLKYCEENRPQDDQMPLGMLGSIEALGSSFAPANSFSLLNARSSGLQLSNLFSSPSPVSPTAIDLFIVSISFSSALVFSLSCCSSSFNVFVFSIASRSRFVTSALQCLPSIISYLTTRRTTPMIVWRSPHWFSLVSPASY